MFHRNGEADTVEHDNYRCGGYGSADVPESDCEASAQDEAQQTVFALLLCGQDVCDQTEAVPHEDNSEKFSQDILAELQAGSDEAHGGGVRCQNGE